MERPVYPFAAIVGQDQMRLGLILAVICPELSGILIRGEKGTAKSTAVRGLAALLPERDEVVGNPYHLSPDEFAVYADGLGLDTAAPPSVERRRVQIVDLPVGATEDRVTGSLDVQAALTQGSRRFEPGLLAAAHRGILYVDEVNLLDNHVVDLLLDSAAMGVSTVEREGLSVTHPARFSLVGTMNPEEGELRPQLLDRFGLCVTVSAETDTASRVEVIRRRLAYEDDPVAFAASWQAAGDELAARIDRAVRLLPGVRADDDALGRVAATCIEAGVDGHRADIMMVRAARALAAWDGRTRVSDTDLDRAGRLVLPHRMRRLPLEGIAQT